MQCPYSCHKGSNSSIHMEVKVLQYGSVQKVRLKCIAFIFLYLSSPGLEASMECVDPMDNMSEVWCRQPDEGQTLLFFKTAG